MATPTLTLDRFLLDRIAEDKIAARAESREESERRWLGLVQQPVDTGWRKDEDSAHTTRWGPARVLAECEAKRGIINQVDLSEHRLDHCDRCMVLRYHAFVYADHPDYQEYWRP